MLNGPHITSMIIFLAVFLGVCALGVLLLTFWRRRHHRAISRLRSLPEESSSGLFHLTQPGSRPASWLTSLGASVLQGQEKRLAQLESRLAQAGVVGTSALRTFLGVRLVLVCGLSILGLALAYGSNRVPLPYVSVGGVAGYLLGLCLPELWLSHVLKRRQRDLRLAVPDALDMLVLCLQAGISLPAAMQRITDQLLVVHPVLGHELAKVDNQTRLGLSVAQALKEFGERSGLDEIREIATVILQSEQSGTSLIKAIRTRAEDYREERYERAKEYAQKSSVKILFPTLLCIFPAIFIVLLGPAAFQLQGLFHK